jgi:hypothetical protein
MIPIRELSTGNYVACQGEMVKIRITNGDKVLVSKKDLTEQWLSIEDLAPVKLSVKILVSFGFTKKTYIVPPSGSNSEEYVLHVRIGSTNRNGIFTVQLYKNGRVKGWYAPEADPYPLTEAFDSVHVLQNLYYWVKREELRVFN